MLILETPSEWALAGTTVVGITATFLLYGKPPFRRSHGLFLAQAHSQLAMMALLGMPYELLFGTRHFLDHVARWAAPPDNTAAEPVPQFDRLLWTLRSGRPCVLAGVLLLLLYVFLKGVCRAAYRHMEVHTQAKPLDLEQPRRVTFVLPREDSWTEIVRARLVAPRAMHRALFAALCLAASVAVVPLHMAGAFAVTLVEYGHVTVTSDHLVYAALMYVACDILATLWLGLPRPAGCSEVKFAVFRLAVGYGFLVVAGTSLACLFAGDMLQVFAYKAVVAQAHNVDIRSFYDVPVDRVGRLSAWFVGEMLAMTYPAVAGASTYPAQVAAVKGSLKQVQCLLGDTVSVLVFATLVVVPHIVGFICTQ